MFPKLSTRLAISSKFLKSALTRNIGSTSILLNKSDPIQQLFVDKAREYFKKKSGSKSGLVDASPQTQKALKDEIEKINKQFGSSATNEFPTFSFSEPKLEPINTDKLERQ